MSYSSVLIHDIKWHRLRNYVWLFDYIPFLDFVLVSGSMAIGNVHTGSDWDVIVGTRDKRLYTARFFCLSFFSLFGYRAVINNSSGGGGDGFCFNHFIENSSRLDLPEGEYEEKMQRSLIPIFGRRDLISVFLSQSGRPILDSIFQDLRYLYRNDTPTIFRAIAEYIGRGSLGDVIERLTRSFQQWLIKKHLVRFGANESSRIVARDNRVELCFKPKKQFDIGENSDILISTMANINPIHDRVFLEAIEEDRVTKSGIVLPDTAEKERPIKGRVVAVGPGKRNDRGELMLPSVKVGDTVLFKKYGPDEVELDGKKYLVAEESDILAILKS